MIPIVLKNKKLVIFDLDGTIGKLDVNWEGCRKEARRLLKNVYKVEPPINKIKMEEIEKWTLENLNEVALKRLISIRNRFEMECIENATIYPSMKKWIKYLYDNHVVLTICSNNLASTVDKYLKHFKLKKYFKKVVGLEDTLRPKPNTSGCELIIKKFNFNKKYILFIGDNKNTDGKTAKLLDLEYLHTNNFI